MSLKMKKTKQWYEKRYQVLFIDEYNNIEEVGWYDDLKDAHSDLNKRTGMYQFVDENGNETKRKCLFGKNRSLGNLTEYAGSFNPVFDRVIDVPEGAIQVRGFVRY